jgi:hypothetical protein
MRAAFHLPRSPGAPCPHRQRGAAHAQPNFRSASVLVWPRLPGVKSRPLPHGCACPGCARTRPRAVWTCAPSNRRYARGSGPIMLGLRREPDPAAAHAAAASCARGCAQERASSHARGAAFHRPSGGERSRTQGPAQPTGRAVAGRHMRSTRVHRRLSRPARAKSVSAARWRQRTTASSRTCRACRTAHSGTARAPRMRRPHEGGRGRCRWPHRSSSASSETPSSRRPRRAARCSAAARGHRPALRRNG